MEFKSWKRWTSLLGLIGVLALLSCGETRKLSEFDYTDEEAEKVPIKKPAQEEYFSESTLRFEDHRYIPSIRTVQLYKVGEPISRPIITLNQGEFLELHFDDLSSDLEDYYYRLYHCNADWTQSDLMTTEYVQGFFSDAIVNYDYSFNTMRQFIHYSVRIPNNNMKILKSGNYVLAVVKDDNEDEPVLTKRFMVVENKVAIVPNVRQTSVVAERDFKQLIDFEVHYASFDLTNPFRDVKTVVMQNGRWDNIIPDLQPVFLRDRILEYRYEQGNDFWGGNEWRPFNISSTRYVSDRVRSVTKLDDHWFVNLSRDNKRNLKNHFTWQDVNGAYLVKNSDGYDDIAESDYISVHFELGMARPLGNGSVYVFGGLTDFKIDKDFQMKYNEELKAYECTAPLKQGYYEYQYAVHRDMSDEIDLFAIEGSHYETDNEYTILIYYRDIRNDYDQLIGAKSFSSLDFF